MIMKEHVFNPKYSPKWQEKPFLPAPTFRNAKMALNFLMSKLEFRMLRSKLVSYPYFALIDPSSVCNLRCPLCPTGTGDMSRPHVLMKFDDYKRIVDQLGDYLLSILFTNWGEPFLNRDFIRMIDYTKHVKRVPFTSVDTNLNIDFTDEQIDALVRSDLDLMCVALDGVTQESYEKYRRGGSLKKVLGNTRRILEKRRELGKERPFVVWQILALKHNLGEIDRAVQMAKEAGVDALRIAAAQVYMSEIDKTFAESYEASKDYIPAPGSEYSGYTAEGKRKFPIETCSWLWKGVVVNSDGGVQPCCAIYPKKYDFADMLKAESFKSIWNGKEYQDARKAVADPAYARKLFEQKSGNACVPCTVYGNWTG